MPANLEETGSGVTSEVNPSQEESVIESTNRENQKKNPRPFEVFIPSSAEEPEAVRGRLRAVRWAKSLSREQSYPVRAVRGDGRVAMTFRDGELVRYDARRRR